MTDTEKLRVQEGLKALLASLIMLTLLGTLFGATLFALLFPLTGSLIMPALLIPPFTGFWMGVLWGLHRAADIVTSN